MKTLTINLTAPLQSYGDEATFERRTSTDYPTKSAVIGMLAAALGYARSDPRIQQLYQLAFATRVDQPGTPLTDFHTVEWKPNVRKITYRDYLQDAVFVVALGADDDTTIDHLAEALTHPHYQLYLGRRSNPPAGPLVLHQFADETPIDALTSLPWQAARWYQRRLRQATFSASVIADSALLPEARNQLTKDVAQSSDQRHRQFTFRAVAQTTVTLDNPTYSAQSRDTTHDVWESL